MIDDTNKIVTDNKSFINEMKTIDQNEENVYDNVITFDAMAAEGKKEDPIIEKGINN